MRTRFLFAVGAMLAIALAGCATTAQIQAQMYSDQLAEQSVIKQSREATRQARYKAGRS